MLKQFRNRYPQGSLISELISVEQGKYVVRVLVQVDGVTLVTALAAHPLVEEAEDKARSRALNLLELEVTPSESPLLLNNILKENSPQIIPPETQSPPEIDLSTPAVNSNPINLPKPSQEKPPEKITPVEVTQPEPEIITPVEVTQPEPEIITPVEVTQPEPEIITPVEVISTPQEIATQPEVTPEITPVPLINSPPLDFAEMMAQTDIEMKRIGWTKDQGKDYLVKTYGKKSRPMLSDEELKEFLDYLQSC